MRLRKLIRVIARVALIACTPVVILAGCGGGESPSTTSSLALPNDPPPTVSEKARSVGANELGEIPVLMYHLIGTTKGRYERTPAEFRDDLAQLKAAGYYPINAHDLASGNMQIPAGKSPIVITFDDSSEGQYRILPGGGLDPDSAVGIMNAMTDAGGWAMRASFFVLLDVHPPGHILFGQLEYRQLKLRNLVSWGYEVGSHTVTHRDLSKASPENAAKELADSETMLNQMIGGGYQVTTLALPGGAYPADLSILKNGSYQGETYAYSAALRAWGGYSPSPFSSRFDPMRINRIEVTEGTVKNLVAFFQKHPDLRYVSDGDPTTMAAPMTLSGELGTLVSRPSFDVVRY